MPYLTGKTETVEKALFLLRFAVPYWGLTYIFGRNDMYWYRMATAIGQHSIVGTTVKSADKLPQDLLADEKHTRFNGQKAYIATTAGDDCVLGASVSLTADTKGLTEAYAHFKAEAVALKPDYQPQTVNTDGWRATANSWKTLFPTIIIINCFLHAFLKIRNCAKQLKDIFTEAQQMVWDAYHETTSTAFLSKINDLKAWTQKHVAHSTAKAAILKLCVNAPDYCLAYDHPTACRASNMIDRAMNPMDRYLHETRYFHGHLDTAECRIRAWALIHNFSPYNPKTKRLKNRTSPFHRLNGFTYHQNWLHNLMIATSMAGPPG